MKRTYLGGLILMMVASGAAANEQSGAALLTNGVTAEALVRETVEKNPERAFYEAEIAAARAGRKTAGTLANPEAAGSVGHKTVRGGGANDDGLAWSASVLQPFEWPGRMGLRKAIANRDIELAELGYERFEAALAGRVRALVYDLFAAREKAAAAHEVAERFKALRDVLVQRDAAGLTPLLETRIIEATELNAQRKASDAALAHRAALLELNSLRGMPPHTPLEVRAVEMKFRSPESSDALQARAATNNFELRLRAVELAQQGFRVDLARNERFPAISLGPTISEENAGERERIAGVGVTVPLPLWTRNTGNIETAKARRKQAEISLELARREVERKLAGAALVYETKLREMGRWRPDAVEHFREAAEVADRHYRLGSLPVSTYVELQKQYLEAVESLLDTRKEALQSAQEIELLTGISPSLIEPAPLKQESAP